MLRGIQHEAYRMTQSGDPTGTPRSVSIMDSDGASTTLGRSALRLVPAFQAAPKSKRISDAAKIGSGVGEVLRSLGRAP